MENFHNIQLNNYIKNAIRKRLLQKENKHSSGPITLQPKSVTSKKKEPINQQNTTLVENLQLHLFKVTWDSMKET